MDLKEQIVIIENEMEARQKSANEKEQSAREDRARYAELKVQRQTINAEISKLISQHATQSAADAAKASQAAAEKTQAEAEAAKKEIEAAKKDLYTSKAETDELNKQLRERLAAMDELLAKAKETKPNE